MSPTRRTFLRTGALAAISAGFALGSVRLVFGQDSKKSNPSRDFEIPHEARLDPVFSYTMATFEPYVGGIFTTRGKGGQKVSLTLVKVKDVRPGARTRNPKGTAAQQAAHEARERAKLTPKSRATDSFALTFRASGPLSDLSTIHQLEHAALGKFLLFLVESEDAEGRYIYEAVINHPVQ